MNLKSGCEFWPQIYSQAERRYPSPHCDIRCDIAIVGGGVSGALMGYTLMKAGINAVLVDRRPIGHGSSAASTGLLQYEVDTSLVELSEMIGEKRATLAYRASLEALLAFEPLVEALGDNCGLIGRPSLYLASSKKDVEPLQAEYAARRGIGISVDFLNHDRLKSEFNIDRPGALLSPQAFEVDPFHLTLQLVKKAAEGGLRVFCDTNIQQVQTTDRAVTLVTAAGIRISARKVIFTMGYETMEEAPLKQCQLTSTYALASAPMLGWSWKDKALIWETARPYLYMRFAGDRIMVGGADEAFADPIKRDALLQKKIGHLAAQFSKLFGKELPVECAWAGTFAQTKDGLPYVGERAGWPGCIFVMGYGGNGITFSMLAAQVVCDGLLGKSNPYTELLKFGR